MNGLTSFRYPVMQADTMDGGGGGGEAPAAADAGGGDDGGEVSLIPGVSLDTSSPLDPMAEEAPAEEEQAAAEGQEGEQAQADAKTIEPEALTDAGTQATPNFSSPEVLSQVISQVTSQAVAAAMEKQAMAMQPFLQQQQAFNSTLQALAQRNQEEAEMALMPKAPGPDDPISAHIEHAREMAKWEAGQATKRFQTENQKLASQVQEALQMLHQERQAAAQARAESQTQAEINSTISQDPKRYGFLKDPNKLAFVRVIHNQYAQHYAAAGRPPPPLKDVADVVLAQFGVPATSTQQVGSQRREAVTQQLKQQRAAQAAKPAVMPGSSPSAGGKANVANPRRESAIKMMKQGVNLPADLKRLYGL